VVENIKILIIHSNLKLNFECNFYLELFSNTSPTGGKLIQFIPTVRGMTSEKNLFTNLYEQF